MPENKKKENPNLYKIKRSKEYMEMRRRSDSCIAVYDENGKLLFKTDQGKILYPDENGKFKKNLQCNLINCKVYPNSFS